VFVDLAKVLRGTMENIAHRNSSPDPFVRTSSHVLDDGGLQSPITVTNGINAVVTCEIKLFQNYFTLRRRPSETILFQRVETCLKLFHRFIAVNEYFPTCNSLLLK